MNGGLRRRMLALYVAVLAVVGIAANGDGFAELLPASVESVGTTTIPRLTTVPPPVESVETTTTSSSSSSTTTSTSTTTTTAAPATTAVARLVTPTAPATTATTLPRTTVAAETSGCHPSYAGACVPIASDVDCAGGGGNGPEYVYTKNFQVVGPDVYGLDGNDNDGIACES